MLSSAVPRPMLMSTSTFVNLCRYLMIGTLVCASRMTFSTMLVRRSCDATGCRYFRKIAVLSLLEVLYKFGVGKPLMQMSTSEDGSAKPVAVLPNTSTVMGWVELMLSWPTTSRTVCDRMAVFSVGIRSLMIALACAVVVCRCCNRLGVMVSVCRWWWMEWDSSWMVCSGMADGLRSRDCSTAARSNVCSCSAGAGCAD